jgi:dsRNA-specific ribonuclease
VLLAIDYVDYYNYSNNKIFADVFESLIAAVYLDSGDMERTWKVLSSLLQPYIEVYVN